MFCVHCLTSLRHVSRSIIENCCMTHLCVLSFLAGTLMVPARAIALFLASHHSQMCSLAPEPMNLTNRLSLGLITTHSSANLGRWNHHNHSCRILTGESRKLSVKKQEGYYFDSVSWFTCKRNETTSLLQTLCVLFVWFFFSFCFDFWFCSRWSLTM